MVILDSNCRPQDPCARFTIPSARTLPVSPGCLNSFRLNFMEVSLPRISTAHSQKTKLRREVFTFRVFNRDHGTSLVIEKSAVVWFRFPLALGRRKRFDRATRFGSTDEESS